MRDFGAILSSIALLVVQTGFVLADDRSSLRDVYARGVVGLQVTYQDWDEDRPWAKKIPKTRGASAVFVGRSQLLTTADIVDNATFIQFSAFGQPRQVEFEIQTVDLDVNLALLQVKDTTVLDDLAPVPLAGRTPSSGTLQTVRWQGQQLEISASRVVRFLVERSRGSRVEYAVLHMRTDISAGGWSEPVFHDGMLVGITISQSKQVSRAIPVEIIRGFLNRVNAPEPYVGFPSLGVQWQVNHDPSVTRFLGQTGEPRGVLVRQVPWGSSGCGVLEPRDILLEVDGNPIDTEGYYHHAYLGRLRFTHVLTEDHRPGDAIAVRVLRGGRELNLPMTLRTYPTDLDLVPKRRSGQPAYVVAGGLILRELDVPYLRTWGKEWNKRAPHSLLTSYYLTGTGQTLQQRRLILITSVLPSDYNIGYQDMTDVLVERINGQLIGSIPDVVAALQDPRDRFHVIELAPESGRGEVVLDAVAFEAATDELLQTYSVPQAVHLPQAPPPEGGGSCAGES